MEFDGYYVLSDLLEKPNLRPRALVWAGPEPSPAYLRRARGSPTRVPLRAGLGALRGVLSRAHGGAVGQGWMEGIPPDVLFRHTCSRP